jgi:hypothetical protein
MDMVLLKHPNRPDEPFEVENTAQALTPWMVKGYSQYKPEEKKAEG